MPERERLFDELRGEHQVGVLLLAQMGGIPHELQLFIETAEFDEAAQGLRERNTYILRVLSVREHRLSLGIFSHLFIAEEHPILLHHNQPKLSVHFEGTPADVNELVLDIHQAYASTFGPWRELAADINREQPLANLLSSGAGQLGTFPQTAAERLGRVFDHHRMTARLDMVEARETVEEHGRSTLWKLLGVGDSYFVALDFAVDKMGQKAVSSR
jgi:hypothetical protein